MAARFRIIETRRGFMGIVGTDSGLRRVFLPERQRALVRRKVRSDYPEATEDGELMPKLAGGLRQYFEGRRVKFDAPLDWSGAPPFVVDVWRACQQLRYGQTMSYGELAERLGRPGAGRAVGTAMSRNPFPVVVPCHRVVKSDGSLGGYSGPGGVAFKRRLLEMEQAGQPALT